MRNIFKKSALFAMAATVAMSTSLSTQTVANAADKEAIIGAIIAGIAKKSVKDKHHHQGPKVVYKKQHKSYHAPKQSYKQHHQAQQQHYKHAHVNWCYDQYRTYDVRSNSFRDYDGYVKKCISPYS